MIPIFPIFIFILIVFLLISVIKEKYNISIILVILLILITAFRKTGYDLNNYYIHFLEMHSFKDVVATLFEPGYSFVALLSKKLFSNFLGLQKSFTILMLFIAATSISLKYITMKKLSPLPLVSFILYFLCFYIYNDFTQIRHGISIAFCFFSLLFVYKKNVWLYLISILVAISFHYSAILFIPVYFLKNIKISFKKFLMIIIISIILSFLNIQDIIYWLNDNIFNSMYIYEKLSDYSAVERAPIFSNLFKIVFSFMFLFYVYDAENDKERIMFNVYLYGILTYGILGSFSLLAYRTNAFFRMPEIILIPIYIKKIPSLKNQLIHILFIALLIIYFLIKFIMLLKDPNYLYYSFI